MQIDNNNRKHNTKITHWHGDQKGVYSQSTLDNESIAWYRSLGSPRNLDREIGFIRNILVNHLRHPVLSDRHFLQYSRLLVRMSQTNRMAHRAACLNSGTPPEPAHRFFSHLYGDELPE
jgi:hypothetical protein